VLATFLQEEIEQVVLGPRDGQDPARGASLRVTTDLAETAVALPSRLEKLHPKDRITVRRIAEEICRERRLSLSQAVMLEAVNLWFQGYRPVVRVAGGAA